MSSFAQNAGLSDHLSISGAAATATMEAERTGSPVSIKRRGRRPGIRTVSDAIESHRREWLRDYTKAPGMKVWLCKQLDAPDSLVSHLLAGRRTFTDRITRHIELVLGLKIGTIDFERVTATTSVCLPTGVAISEDKKCTLDPDLEMALVNIFRHVLSQKLVSNEIAIKILVEITAL